jgi:L-rhamnose-H+ transport protein
LILFSNIYGKLFREWEGARRPLKMVVNFGMAIIVIATIIVTRGTYLGQLTPTH